MDFFYKPALKYFLIFAVTLGMGFSVWLLPHGTNKKDERGEKDESVSITTPIDAKDEAGRYLQQASEEFFYHEFDKAIESYGKAMTAFENESQLEKAAKVYESIGDLYKFRTRIKEAEEQYIIAMEYHHKIKNPLGEARAMNRAGDLFMERGEHAPAGDWYKKGVALVKDLPPHQTQAVLFESMGRIYWKIEENIPEAILWYTRARDSFSALENQMGYDHMTAVLNKLRGGQNLNTH
jgi:tetratricopeptide (TPR) repeat protein